MSEAPTNAPQSAGRRENVFTHKIGPLPMWGWLAIVGGALIGWRIYSGKQAAASGATATTATTTPSTPADQVPQFVNQTYVSTGAPLAPGSSGSTPPPMTTPPSGTTGGTPTWPSPVSTVPSVQPKPSTTLSNWSYPAPTGLGIQNQGKGVYLTWNAVTGPSGQHPNSYTVATYDSKGKLVDQHATTAGNNQTAEFGPGGKGLPKGTYHSNVWANGGPIAPPHATVQYTLQS